MKRAILTLLTTIALSLTAMAQDKPDPYLTGHLRNGRAWMAMSFEAKIEYLMGYGDHWRSADCTNQRTEMPLYQTNGETAKGLTTFFAEPANRNITIRTALMILSLKASGSSDYTVEQLTLDARKDAMKTLDTAK